MRDSNFKDHRWVSHSDCDARHWLLYVIVSCLNGHDIHLPMLAGLTALM